MTVCNIACERALAPFVIATKGERSKVASYSEQQQARNRREEQRREEEERKWWQEVEKEPGREKQGRRSEVRLKGNEMFPGKISKFHSEKATNNIKILLKWSPKVIFCKTTCNKTLLLCVIIKDKNKIQFVMVEGNKIQK